MTAITVPVQGYKARASLGATDSDGSLALVVSPGKSRGIGIELSGTWAGTVQFEQLIGSTWIAKTVYPAAGGTGVTSATATGTWKAKAGGETYIRVRCSAFTSGSIVTDIALTAGDPDAAVTGTAGTPSGGVQSVQGVAGGTLLPIKNNITLIAVTPTISTAGAYAAGSLLFDVTAIASAVLVNGDGCWIDSITLIDKDAQNAAIDLYICQSNITLGSLRAAPTISAANWLVDVPVRVGQVGTGDWSTVKSGLSTATVNLGKMVQAGAATTSLYITGIAQSAPTYTNAANLVLEIAIGR